MNLPLITAEKDYMLAIVLKLLYEAPISKKLVFKGGTALYHCHLPQLRFSEDIDFTAIDESIKMNELKSVFEPYDFYNMYSNQINSI